MKQDLGIFCWWLSAALLISIALISGCDDVKQRRRIRALQIQMLEKHLDDICSDYGFITINEIDSNIHSNNC